MALLKRAAAQPDLAPVHLAGAVLGARRHVCAFFTSQEDHYRILLPFITEGFERGEKAVHIVNPQRRGDHESRLAAAGIDPAEAQKSRQLELREWSEAHVIDGFFDQERTRRVIDEICGRSAADGFRRIRFVTQMEWAVESETDMDALLEYEARVNLTPVDHPVVCAYDLTKFRGDVVVDVMRTHPMVIVGGILQENPFFVPPEEFLRDLRQRGGHASR
jgi:DcmR-like sensory protein